MTIRNSLSRLTASVFFLAIILTCGRAGVDPTEEPTNEDAIYNIIRFDRASEFNLDFPDFTVPDTSALLGPPYRVSYFWRHLTKDSLFIEITINYTESPSDSITNAYVTATKYFWGTLEIIAQDTSGGNGSPIRLSKPFTITGKINAYFEKLGFDYNTHRGWLLREISDVYYGPIPSLIESVEFYGASAPNERYYASLDLRPLGDFPEFSPGDSIIVNVQTGTRECYIKMKYRTETGFQLVDTLLDGDFTLGFKLPSRNEFDHFLIDIFDTKAVADTFRYVPAAVGALYRIR